MKKIFMTIRTCKGIKPTKTAQDELTCTRRRRQAGCRPATTTTKYRAIQTSRTVGFINLQVLILSALMLIITGCGETDANVIPENGSLLIPLNEVTETAKFYPVKIDGTDMEIIAVKDSSGNIKTAFNTCRSCYNSGNGRYSVEGTELVCGNCGFHFIADDIGKDTRGGCSPWYIADSERIITDDNIYSQTMRFSGSDFVKIIYANFYSSSPANLYRFRV